MYVVPKAKAAWQILGPYDEMMNRSRITTCKTGALWAQLQPIRAQFATPVAGLLLIPVLLLGGCASDSQPIEDLVSGTLLPSSETSAATTPAAQTGLPPLTADGETAAPSAANPEEGLLTEDERQKAAEELKSLAHGGAKPVTSSRRRIDQLRELGKKHGSDALDEIESTPSE
ncbi:hypothetical protein [Coralliovum pocilloporae]|uniref:hypothetical protein n=1 Tax=Coralliovum pocilloporae TaxID=3066369 RepID=UPI00330741FF